ncbi:efflux RND transporter periplasmic adaptor subunit [Candidatus Vondammii sp. HM_W22]|uniref:efflux RND transporter periplasmic adaptor subunit n=1 Tax=Candidatus Vondammii sp. HM_W22 TaxID=2687299 RepID=UPI001F13690C|nr:efflux RND transporter periplasmic adaptor subunit [Candidatus Vondammii sp. HM_W22]
MTQFIQKIVLATATLLLLPMLSFAGGPGGKPNMPVPKADVFIIEVQKDLPIILKYPAQIKPFEKVNVVARASGVLEKKYFREGEKVVRGDLLYSIEDDVYVARVNVAKSSLKISQAVFNNALRSWNRIKNLFKDKIVSEDKRDTALSVYEQALASLSLSKANLEQAQIDLDYSKVKAPISGVIGLKKVDIGDFVSASPPTNLIEITHNNRVYVEFSMPLRDYSNIKNDLWITPENGHISVELEIDNNATNRTGMVDFVDVNIQKSTSTVKMRAVVENGDGYLMPGGFVRVIIHDIVQKNVITIPQKAVTQSSLGTTVFVAENGRVSVKSVILGRQTGDKYIVAGGPLTSGDQVIINNFFRLKPDAEVQIDKIINAEGN